MSSIRLRLLKYLIGPILLINLAVGALTWLLAWTPAQLSFDQGLADAAGVLAARVRSAPGGVVLDLPPQAEQVLRAAGADTVYFVARHADGRHIAGDADFPPLSSPAAGGARLVALDAAMRGEALRVVALELPFGNAVLRIGVGKTLRERQQLRAQTLRGLLLLEILFSMVLVALIWFSVTNALQPLGRLRADLAGRDGDELAPVGAQPLPYELAPVVGAFNDLLGKVAAGAQARHEFLADVAHQLRTPLSGFKLQLEWLAQRHAGDADSTRSLGLMLQSNERMIRQVNQLLSLARAEPGAIRRARHAPLDLAALVADAVQHFVDQAAVRGIDLGFNLQPARVVGDPFLLGDLISNLIDNAVRYTPRGGAVTVSCLADAGARAVLVVEDDGPGIPAGRREAVFGRFVRLDDKSGGSGLGLSIVQQVALAHGAEIVLTERAEGSGAVFSVRFPAMPPAPAE